MELRDIQVFLALSDELHFGRAAERLHVSTSHVSQLVRRLERQVGGALFERTSRKVELTPLGRRFGEGVRPAYEQLHLAFDEARAAARQTVGQLRIGFTGTTDGDELAQLVEVFESRHPTCEVRLHEIHSVQPYAALRQDEIEILVHWLVVGEPGLTAGPIVALRPRVLAVAASDPLARRSSVSVEDLADREVCDRPPDFPELLYDRIVPPSTPSGRTIPRTHSIGTVYEILSLIRRRRIVHPTAAGALPARRGVTYVPIRDLPPLPLGLVWTTRNENARIRAFAAVASEQAARIEATRPDGGGERS
ncbi:LysR family transcriptional regulator [Kribbella sp. NPDC026611]|uniref:LysR family transcriptional regulator n=1 Tax=Kribbella sp. NPDC026611 TaxID=3154911 RepID=UPI0033DE44D4